MSDQFKHPLYWIQGFQSPFSPCTHIFVVTKVSPPSPPPPPNPLPPSLQTVVSTAVTTQLSVSTFQELGCGKVDKHIADYKNRIPTSASSGTKPHSHAISHLSPLLLNSKLGIRTQESPANKHGVGLGQGLGAAVATPVGVLGHQTPSAALDCLRATPLLEDLAEWSHWDLVFRPQFGSLSDFILSPAARGEISALEISPGKLIKISPGSSIQDFYKAVDSFDATNAAGHLVSLVVTRGNTRDISVQLLASHVLASLQRRLAECEEGEGREENEGAVARFMFACLTRIPVRICELIANEVSMCGCYFRTLHYYYYDNFLKVV